MKKPKHPEHVIPTAGPAGNIFMMVGRAVSLMKEVGGYTREDVDNLRQRVAAAQSYEEAKAILRELFTIEGDS